MKHYFKNCVKSKRNQIFTAPKGHSTAIFLNYNQLIPENELFQDIFTYSDNVSDLTPFTFTKKAI